MNYCTTVHCCTPCTILLSTALLSRHNTTVQLYTVVYTVILYCLLSGHELLYNCTLLYTLYYCTKYCLLSRHELLYNCTLLNTLYYCTKYCLLSMHKLLYNCTMLYTLHYCTKYCLLSGHKLLYNCTLLYTLYYCTKFCLLFRHELLYNCTLLVLNNKDDRLGTCSNEEVASQLGLNQFNDRDLTIQVNESTGLPTKNETKKTT